MTELLQEILPKLSQGNCPNSKWPDSKGEYWANCPFHIDQQNDDFSVSERGFNCFACGKQGSLTELAELLQCCTVEKGEILPPSPLTLEEYAKAKDLPLEELKELGLETVYYKKEPSVKIAYYDENGSEVSVRFRLTLKKGKKDNRFRWRSGNKPLPYGLWKLDEMRQSGYVILVEGESDCHTAWHYGLPAIGIPGATNWKKEWAGYFNGLTVYVWAEADNGGKIFCEKVGETIPAMRIITPPTGRKDLSEAHMLEDDIPALIKKLMSEARPYVEIQREKLNVEATEAKHKANKLLNEPNILSKVSEITSDLGLVGEDKNAKLIYLAVTSRMLDKPVNIVVKGPSSGGKSFTVETVLKMFPGNAYYALSSMSERALAYSEEPLQHRFLVLYEAAGLNSDFGTYLMRTLLSEGCIRYETVESTNDGIKPKLVTREGPTGLIVTTTWSSLHPENETRMFSITVKDSTTQTQAVLNKLADRANGKGPKAVDLTSWHALQTWLELAGNHQVTIPFAHDLATKASPKAVRLRRDFGAILNLIATHAILHQTQRQRNEDGRIIATIEDYKAVYELIIDILNEGVQATVSETIRETVKAVEDINPKPVKLAQLVAKLGLDKSAVSRRVKVAIDNGYLVNLEEKKGKPAKLELGESLPNEETILPKPDELLKPIKSDDDYYAELADQYN